MDSEKVTSEIGKKIRDLRKQNGLTQQELADRAELTKGFISQLERGQVSPSVVTLMDLIEILGTTPSDFFMDTVSEQIVFREKDYFEKIDEAGNSIEWVVPSAQSNQMEPVLVTLKPHEALPVDEPHNGEEFGYVLNGRILLYREDVRFEVKSGESFYYEADKPHRIENPGNRPARFIWVSTPPSF
ncbi:MAG: helix-turn-helix transcriptional regulator [Lachnospiraceae bacterium]|nr:helix-turn-helix transcriptional regulator [Lachnospiraceae bacterium]